MSLRFTADWLTQHLPNWEIILKYLNKTFDQDLNCLEVGTYEGRAAIYMLENFVGKGKLTIIDQFIYVEPTKNYVHNITTHPKHGQVNTLTGLSFNKLSTLAHEQFDFIYIDAGKTAGDALGNLILAERLLKVGGIMLIDDYGWNHNPDPRCCPKLGVDSFINVTLLCEVFMEGYQLAFKKIKDNQTLLIVNR